MFKQSIRLVRGQTQIFPKRFLGQCEVVVGNACLLHKDFVIQHFESPLKRFEQLNYLNCRRYSKSRDIKKEKKKVIKIREDELSQYFDVEKLFTDIQKPVELFKEELALHATLRTSSGAIEDLKVKFDGSTYSIKDLAEIGKKNPSLYVLDFSAFPEAIQHVLATFRSSELNINVQQQGTSVFVPIPKVTKGHREVLAKKCKLYFVKCKDSIREIQMEYIKSLRNIEKLSIDEKFSLTDQLTALGNKHISLAEEIMKAKQDELLKLDEIL